MFFFFLNSATELKIRAPRVGARGLGFISLASPGPRSCFSGGGVSPSPAKTCSKKSREPTGKWRKNVEWSLNGRSNEKRLHGQPARNSNYLQNCDPTCKTETVLTYTGLLSHEVTAVAIASY